MITLRFFVINNIISSQNSYRLLVKNLVATMCSLFLLKVIKFDKGKVL